MARVRELMLLAVVACVLANVATAFTTGSCIREAGQLVKVLDAQPKLYSAISAELKKLVTAVQKGYDVSEFYDSTLLIPTNAALAAAKVDATKIKNNEKLYRLHILDSQDDNLKTSVGMTPATSLPGKKLRVFKAPAAPFKVALGVVGSTKPAALVLAHLHTGTGNCFEAYGIDRVLA
ncbi:hypothetical protein CLOM_g19478 [Closterium sp. NIES-68]|nr:hypothetical protein CLOM_g19478 [Closterium sp. NIES-68]GJP81971.1 hypothetical protein CLOP_g12097 [Closterium sp. NIES-67]